MSTTPNPAAQKKTSGGLGRGLGALIPQKPIAAIMPTASASADPAGDGAPIVTGQPLLVPLSEIIPNPEQPRIHFKPEDLEDLTNSIKEHGILQPLTVTRRIDGGYELIAGERRFRASKLAGLEKVPVIIREGNHDMNQKLVLALIENIQRADLNAMEEARGYQRLMEEFGLTQDEVAKRVGKARSTVANTLRLLTLPQVIRDGLSAGAIAPGSARAILALGTEAEQVALFHKLVNDGLSTRAVEAGVRKTKKAVEVRKDPAITGAEESLRNALGTRVEINKKGGAGSFVISFFSEEEYGELLRKLSKS